MLVRRLDPALPLPRPALPGDAAADLSLTADLSLPPGERATVGTGIALALPSGYAGFVLPRSGLAARHGLTVVNAPGTVDAGYRGEIKVTVLNTDTTETVRLPRGSRIAQLLVLPVPAVRLVEVATLPGAARAERGFGSTGTSAPVAAEAPPTAGGPPTTADGRITDDVPGVR